ncbi:MAG: hypothetical protein A4E23_01689 [Methanomethylovorans sp. PtaU1.Bin073]|nr:MAG: hypothetical protein A4E23_01689 [Methanomethylovorans sp. PtaU1.Bin073]
MANRSIDLQLDWVNGGYVVNMVADNIAEREAMDDFVRMCITRGKKVIFITATKGRFNYDKYLERGGHIPTMLMGPGGDPTESAGEQLILSDTWRMDSYGKNSFNIRFPFIQEEILKTLAQAGKKRVVIVARKAAEADAIRQMVEEEIGWIHDTEHRRAENDYIVTHFRGKDSHSGRFYFYTPYINWYGKKQWIKTPADYMVFVGGSDSPGHCMDRYCRTADESRKMRLVEMFMQMCQMAGRIRGNGRSVVQCIGINASTIRDFIKWGTIYKMEIEGKPNSPKISIDVGKEISKPSVVECKTMEERLARARLYLDGFFGVIQFADIGKTEFFSENWDTILEKQITKRQGFSPYFIVPQFRQLPKLPATVKTVKLLSEAVSNSKSLYIYIRDMRVDTEDPNLIILETDNGIQILRVGKKLLRTPADISNFSGSLYCGSIETVAEVLEHYLGIRSKEIQRTDAEKQVREILNQVRVSPVIQVSDGMTLLKQVFCFATPCVNDEGEYIPGPKYIAKTAKSIGTARDRHGNDKRLTEQHLFEHMAGGTALVVYTIDELNEVRYIAFDINAHDKEGKDTLETYKKKIEDANMWKNLVVGMLKNMGIDYPMVEKSGSLGSWHIVVPCLPAPAYKAHYFVKLIAQAVGYQGETFPKQSHLNDGEYGNGLKLPFCYSPKAKVYSCLWHQDEKRYVRYHVPAYDGMITGGYDKRECYWSDGQGNRIESQSFPIQVIDINGIEIPEECKPTAGRMNHVAVDDKVRPMRPIFKWALQQRDLTEKSGHYLRVGLVYEMWFRCHMTEDQIFDAFRDMELVDFDPDTTLKYIRFITRNPKYDRAFGWEKITLIMSEDNKANFVAGRPFVPDDYDPVSEWGKLGMGLVIEPFMPYLR